MSKVLSLVVSGLEAVVHGEERPFLHVELELTRSLVDLVHVLNLVKKLLSVRLIITNISVSRLVRLLNDRV